MNSITKELLAGVPGELVYTVSKKTVQNYFC